MTPSTPVHQAQVAVIGASGRFPGAADVEAFWGNLREGVESIHAFTEQELLEAGESIERLADPSYVRACGRLDGIDLFDAKFFGLSPRDAAVFEPQQRLFLECAWEAFESAGHVGARGPGHVGVFACAGPNEYFTYNLVRNRKIMDSVGPWLLRHTGNDASFLATRVSYELDLRGPSMSVQTACSSSLLAVHLASQSLLAFECDLALAGGATVYPVQNRGYRYRRGEILSPDGHCRAFDARASGTVMGSAVGCVVLRRLEDARRDGDRVLAVILGSAVNNDGSDKVGYLSPSVEGQARVVREALSVSGVSASDVSYVEAHGTGTPIGDPIEVAALTQAFRAMTAEKQFCALGSVKTNIGHAGEASGVCGFLKTVLALGRREIPPSLHYEEPNPQIDFDTSPFFVSDSLRDWVVPVGKRRIAGVTSLGVGGTNVHVIVAEDDAPPLPHAAQASQPHLLVLSAKTAAALDKATDNLIAFARVSHDVSLADVAHTLLSGREAFAFRRAVVACDAAEAADALATKDPKRVVTHHHDGRQPPSIVFLFPGGGSQFGGMGADLYRSEPVYRNSLEECLGGVEASLANTIRELLLADPERVAAASDCLESPSLTLPALFATEYALAELLVSWGVAPVAMVGHSAGEYVAACVAATFSPRDGMRLVALRGRLFETLPEGSMLGVALPEESVRPFVTGDVSLAAVNGPELCVLAGPAGAMTELGARLRASGIASSRVAFRVAAHSSLVEPILPEFEAFVRTVALHPPQKPFASNVTGTWITEAQATNPGYWARHLRGTVRFKGGIEAAVGLPGAVLVEVGPGRVLAGFARQIAKGSFAIASTMPKPQPGAERASLLSALGQLWVRGVPLDDGRLHRSSMSPRRVALPTYPFERQRYWVDPDPAAPELAQGAAGRAEVEAIDVAASLAPPATPEGGGESAAPRTPVEKELGVIWREFLGLEQVGIHDDFFDLGGQSLLAVRIFQRIAEKYGVDLPLASLFEAPTIAQCAALVEASLPNSTAEQPTDHSVALASATKDARPGGGDPTRPRSSAPRAFEPLVLVRPGGTATPFFCVHGSGGNVVNLRDVALAMDLGRDVYGLQAHGIDGLVTPLSTIEEMARAYLPSIRARQPEGPYLLGGYSGGGLVALEMAHQLEAQGQDVSLLALLDTLHPQVPLRGLTLLGRVARLRAEGWRYLSDGFARRRERRRRRDAWREIERCRAHAEPVPMSLRELHLTTHFDRAAWAYRPRPWGGRTILFRAGDVEYIFKDAGPLNGWERDLLGEIQVVPVPGDHATLVLGASGGVIARSLDSAIATREAAQEWWSPTTEEEGAASSSHGEPVAVPATAAVVAVQEALATPISAAAIPGRARAARPSRRQRRAR